MHPFRWAIVGPGAIAHRFADAVHRLPDTELSVVCGRDLERSERFARHWCRDGKAVRWSTDLDAVLADGSVDGVYVATPHTHHLDPALRALRAGKAVLCEKPMSTGRAEAEALVDASRLHGRFLMEALWTRFLPIYGDVADWLRSGAIGALRGVQSSFCFNVPYDARSRLFDPALGGGCLLDIGVYGVSLARWALTTALGSCPEPSTWICHGALAPSGVEARASVQLGFAGGEAVQLVCGFDAHAENALHLYGERGHIVVPSGFWEAQRATLFVHGAEPRHRERSFAINGFEYEVREAIDCARAGLVESPRMPHAETLAALGWIDRLRALAKAGQSPEGPIPIAGQGRK